MLTRDKLFEPWRNFSCIESRVTPQSNHFSSVCEMEIWISVFITICYMLTGWQVTCSMYKQTWLITWQAAVKTLEKPLPFLNVWFFSGVCSLVLLILWSVLLLYIVIKATLRLWCAMLKQDTCCPYSASTSVVVSTLCRCYRELNQKLILTTGGLKVFADVTVLYILEQ